MQTLLSTSSSVLCFQNDEDLLQYLIEEYSESIRRVDFDAPYRAIRNRDGWSAGDVMSLTDWIKRARDCYSYLKGYSDFDVAFLLTGSELEKLHSEGVFHTYETR